MKRHGFLILIALITGTMINDPSNAQSILAKGSYSISGGVSYTTSKYDGDENRSEQLILNPGVYYFVQQRLAAGFSFQYESTRSAEYIIGDQVWGYDSYGAGPSVRYYLGNNRLYPFFSAGYYFSKTKYNGSDESAKSNDLTLGIGFDYMLTSNLALEVAGNYHFIKNRIKNYTYRIDGYETKRTDNVNSSQFNIMIGFYAFIF